PGALRRVSTVVESNCPAAVASALAARGSFSPAVMSSSQVSPNMVYGGPAPPLLARCPVAPVTVFPRVRAPLLRSRCRGGARPLAAWLVVTSERFGWVGRLTEQCPQRASRRRNRIPGGLRLLYCRHLLHNAVETNSCKGKRPARKAKNSG